MGTRTAKNTYKQGQTHVQWGNCFYKQVSDTQTQVCLKAGGGSEKSRFWVQKRPFKHAHRECGVPAECPWA